MLLTRQEVQPLLAALDGVSWIMAMLLYGAGLRLIECLRLRVKDIELTRRIRQLESLGMEVTVEEVKEAV